MTSDSNPGKPSHDITTVLAGWSECNEDNDELDMFNDALANDEHNDTSQITDPT